MSHSIGYFSLPIYPQLRFAQINVVIPDNSVACLIYMNIFEKSVVFE